MKKVVFLMFFMVQIVAFNFVLNGCGCLKNGGTKTNNKTSNQQIVENQLAPPNKGEQIAVFNIANYGSFKCKFFEKTAPKAVKNFIELAKQGKFNGLKLNEVVPDLLISAANNIVPIDGKPLECEHNLSVHHYNGAMCVDLNEDEGGGFYIVFSSDGKRADFDDLEQNVMNYVDDESFVVNNFKFDETVRTNYRNHGGYPVFDMTKNTIFGQVFEGLNVIEQILNGSQIELDEFSNDEQPETQIVIEKVEILTY